MRILIWGMMLFTSLHVYSATLPGFKGNLADKIHPSLKMALLKEEMISDTSYISLLEIKAIEKLELQNKTFVFGIDNPENLVALRLVRWKDLNTLLLCDTLR